MAVRSLFFILSLLFACSYAHMYLNNVKINGVAQGQFECIRNKVRNNNPIPLVTSSELTCGFGGTAPAARMCPIQAGQKMGLQWWWQDPGDMVVDASHRGPCLIYMAKNDGQYNWFKVWEDGYNNALSQNQFCVDRLRDGGVNGEGKGIMEFTIPAQLAPGNYLVRGETIALHGAWEMNGAQPYVACAEITVTGQGNVNPTSTVKLPGAYSANDPGIFVTVYPVKPPYVIPGPAVTNFGSSSVTTATTAAAATSSRTTATSATSATSATTRTTATTATSSTPATSAATAASGTTATSPTSASSGVCVGAVRCKCTAGKGCDPGLSCVSDICVDIGTAVKGDSSSLSSSFAVLFAAVFAVALMNIF